MASTKSSLALDIKKIAKMGLSNKFTDDIKEVDVIIVGGTNDLHHNPPLPTILD